ncbi:MAG: hypothetical protein JXA73_17040 [Acidobacteria bacterium]|nr:hypothetical protein [Acidobacteriota bacterium]
MRLAWNHEADKKHLKENFKWQEAATTPFEAVEEAWKKQEFSTSLDIPLRLYIDRSDLLNGGLRKLGSILEC